MQPHHRPFTWPFITKHTLFMLFFLTVFPTKHMKLTFLTEADPLDECVLWCVYTLVCAGGGLCSVPLNGGHRSVKMCLQKRLLAADRWPTGPWIACLTFQEGYQPVFPIVVAHGKRATCSPTAVINEDDFFFLPCVCDTSQKRWYWHLRLGRESIASSQAVWLSKTHKRRALLWLEDWLIVGMANIKAGCQFLLLFPFLQAFFRVIKHEKITGKSPSSSDFKAT